MKLVSRLQDWYSAYHDKKLRKFESRCLDDIASMLPEHDRRVLTLQLGKVKGVYTTPFPCTKILWADYDMDERFLVENGRRRDGLMARMEYRFPGVQSVSIEAGLFDGMFAGFVASRRMTWRERCEADCELISVQLYPPAPSLPPDFDVLMAHRGEVEVASGKAVTIMDRTPRKLYCWGDRWFWFLGEIQSQYYLLQDDTPEGMVRLLDFSAHEYSAECPCVIPLLKWAAAHLDYLDSPDIDEIARAVAQLPDPPGATVTPLIDA